MLRKRITRIIIVLTLGIAALSIYKAYHFIYGKNVPTKLDNQFVKIPTGSTFDDLVAILKEEGMIKDEESFRSLAALKKFDQKPVRTGRYKIEEGWSNQELINHLRSGPQATVKLIIHNERLISDVAGKAAQYLESDSLEMLKVLTDEAFLKEHNYTLDDVMTVFIPNTYDFYWNTSPKGFFKRMLKEHDRFWSQNNRLEKAEALGMSPGEIYTLASIVEKETLAKSERPRVAGLYLNRLKKGIRLQADPTAVFATRDFDTRRVTNKHIQFDSPYNTYLYAGLPPGPISMASIVSINAVLNAEKHNYLYMCAKPDNSGLHAFAKTLNGHNENARKYRKWLNSRGIR